MTFKEWWQDIGSTIRRFYFEEETDFAERIAMLAWNASVEAQAKMADPRDLANG